MLSKCSLFIDDPLLNEQWKISRSNFIFYTSSIIFGIRVVYLITIVMNFIVGNLHYSKEQWLLEVALLAW